MGADEGVEGRMKKKRHGTPHGDRKQNTEQIKPSKNSMGEEEIS